MQNISALPQNDPLNPLRVSEYGSAGTYPITIPKHLDPQCNAGFMAGYHGIGPRALTLALTYRVYGNAGTTPARIEAVLENLVSQLPKHCGWTIPKDQIRKAAEGEPLDEVQLAFPMYF